MSTATPQDAIAAALSVAEDVANGTLDPTALEHQLTEELRQLVGTVVGPGDPLFELQCEVARGVLAAGGIPHPELSEWTAVMRRRAGEAAAPSNDPPTPVSSASGASRAGNGGPGADA